MYEYSLVVIGAVKSEASDVWQRVRENWPIAAALAAMLILGGRVLETVDSNSRVLGLVQDRQNTVLQRLAAHDQQFAYLTASVATIERAVSKAAPGIIPPLLKRPGFKK